MLDLVWRFLFTVAVGSLVWLLHSYIGEYPNPLPRSENPRRDIWEALFLWGVAIIVPVLTIFILTPQLDQAISDSTTRQLLRAPLLTIPYIILPLFLVLKVNRWTAKDFGLTWKSQSRSVTIFALAVGFGSGGIAYMTGQANISIERLPVGELLILIYNNAFIEEFYHRGVIQSLLERSIGQSKAIWLGGILFGLTHLVFDLSVLRESGIMFVFFAVLLQTMAGWLFGIIYMKTRTLWPGIACHYLANWLPSILTTILG